LLIQSVAGRIRHPRIYACDLAARGGWRMAECAHGSHGSQARRRRARAAR